MRHKRGQNPYAKFICNKCGMSKIIHNEIRRLGFFFQESTRIQAQPTSEGVPNTIHREKGHYRL